MGCHGEQETKPREVYGRESPVKVPGLEQMTKPNCATEVSAGGAGAKSSYKALGAGDTDKASNEEHWGQGAALPHPDEAPNDEHREWVAKSSGEKVPGKDTAGKGTTGAEVNGRERPVEVPGLEQMTKPNCATEVSAGEAGAKSSHKVLGAGDTDEATDEEHRGPGAALPHPDEAPNGEHREWVAKSSGEKVPGKDTAGKGTTGAEVIGRE